MRIALATCESLATLTPGDRRLAAALTRRGAEVIPWVWTCPAPPSLDAVVLRSVWDYADHRERFGRWLLELDQHGAPVLNPPEVLRWNLDKRYLLELERAGATIPRSISLESPEQIADIFDQLPGDRAVAKAAVSNGGKNMAILKRSEPASAQRVLDALLEVGPVLVQEYAEEIEEEGEVSLVFLAGQFSHAIYKRPAPGEFRVHAEYGGTVEPFTPSFGLVDQAAAVASSVKGDLDYARVDGLLRDGKLLLMELELIEPELFFEVREGAAGDLAEHVLTRARAAVG